MRQGAAVTGGVNSVMMNSGQSCRAPTRMLVPNKLMDEVCAIAQEVAETWTPGDPAANSRMGPVISDAAWQKVQRLIKAGIDEGATLVTGGLGKPDGLDEGYYCKPTVFRDVRNDMAIAREEIFGPVLSIIGYDDEDEAIRIANDTEYGLGGYVQSQNLDHARRIAARIRAGYISLNNAGLDISVPFGGYKQSGNGREFGEHAFGEFLELKSVLGYSPARARSGMKVSVRLSKRVRGMKGSMASINLSQGNAAGAIFDQAGQRGKYSPPVQRGAAFVDALNRKYGKAQRALWPAAVGKLPQIRRAFIMSIDFQESKTNQKLKRY